MSQNAACSRWRFDLPRGRALELDQRPKVMGIINVTPDSFSDGGLWLDPADAVAHGLHLLAEGADLLDIGAESTRPGGGVYGEGAAPVSVEEELERLLPVLEQLRQRTEAPLSVDTRKGAVASRALAAGADLINDVGGLRDPELVEAVARSGCPVVIMHSRGDLSCMQRDISFEDVVTEVCAELDESMARATAAGISRDQLILDPGIGFGKTRAQNLQILRQLEVFSSLERPLLVGASRKSFIAGESVVSPEHRLGGSLAAAAWAVSARVAILRAHDVAETVQFLDVWNAIHLSGCSPSSMVE